MTEFIKNRKQILTHFFVWTILILAMVFFMYSEGRKIRTTFGFKIGFGILIFYINYCLLVPRLLLQKKKIYYLISIILLLIITYLIISNIIPISINKSQNLAPKPPRFIRISFLHALILVVGTIIKIYKQWIENDND